MTDMLDDQPTADETSPCKIIFSVDPKFGSNLQQTLPKETKIKV